MNDPRFLRKFEADKAVKQTAVLQERLVGCRLHPEDQAYYLAQIHTAIENLKVARIHVLDANLEEKR